MSRYSASTAGPGANGVTAAARQAREWLRRHDMQYLALRRAARTAIVMPALFAIGTRVVGNADLATFAAFGSFAMLLLTEFGGTRADRFRSTCALGMAGAVLVALGTLASQQTWLAVTAMAVVGFVVLFAGVVSSVIAGATTALLLAFVLPVATPAPIGEVAWRIAGWSLAAAVAALAIVLLWPAPERHPLRAPARDACRAIAQRLRVGVAAARGEVTEVDTVVGAVSTARTAVEQLQAAFYATPYRPTGLSTSARMVVRLVDELGWLAHMLDATDPRSLIGATHHADLQVCTVRLRAADVLGDAAAVLDGDGGPLTPACAALSASVSELEQRTTAAAPISRDVADDAAVTEFVTSLEPRFRAQELANAVDAIAGNVARMAVADRRSWVQRLVGRQPDGVDGTVSAAWTRAAGHLDPRSVWLQNSVRGAAALGTAVLVADVTAVQHSFWVVLGTLSVLRSTALATGQNVLRALAGNIAGVIVGGLLVWAIGTSTSVLWGLLPVAILVAGIAPAAISFAAGQAAFTVTLLVLFNLIAPLGWDVGLIRIEDIAIGCAVSVLVGVLFWPRGAATALRDALATGYRESSAYLAAAVRDAVARCDRSSEPLTAGPAANAAAAAARRLDDVFRTFLAERGEKALTLADVSSLVTGVAGLRLAADAIVRLWQHPVAADGDRAAVRLSLVTTADRIGAWYDALADALVEGTPVPPPTPADAAGAAQLVAAVRRDLTHDDGAATATGVRVVWTGDHLDVARRLQAELVGPAAGARAVVAARRPRAPRALRSGLRRPAFGR